MDDQELLGALPAKARSKYETMSRAAHAARAAVRTLYDELQDEREKLRDALMTWRRQSQTVMSRELRAWHRQQRAAAGGDTTELPEPAEALELRNKIAELEKVRAEADAIARTVSAPVNACRSWLETVVAAGAKIVEAERPDVKLPRGDALGAVADLRARIATLAVEYEQVERAPMPAGTIKARALAFIDHLAAQGAPTIFTGSGTTDPLDLDFHLQLAGLGPVHGSVADCKLVPNSTLFLAWTLRDVLKQRAAELIDATPIEGAVEEAARDERLRTLAAEKLAVERMEEAMIERAAATGMSIPRRGDADPRAVLGVVDQ